MNMSRFRLVSSKYGLSQQEITIVYNLLAQIIFNTNYLVSSQLCRHGKIVFAVYIYKK